VPSPFPGMNPYLEGSGDWEDFHGGFLHRLRAQLTLKVIPRYRVRVDKQVYLREMPDLPWRLVGKPDLAVTGGHGAATVAVAVMDSPVKVQLQLAAVEEVSLRRLEILDTDSEEVVTVLELLSPANKSKGSDRVQYLRKRERLIESGVNFVELDLLRGGPRTSPDIPACDYCALVARIAEVPTAGVWPWRLADPMPPIPVPLRPGEPEPTLDLKAALDAVYDEAGYDYTVYRREPDPALTAEQAAWAAGFVRESARG
jgi:hypothetical protein